MEAYKKKAFKVTKLGIKSTYIYLYKVMLSNIVPDYSTSFIFNSIRHYRVIKLTDQPRGENVFSCAIKYATTMLRKLNS